MTAQGKTAPVSLHPQWLRALSLPDEPTSAGADRNSSDLHSRRTAGSESENATMQPDGTRAVTTATAAAVATAQAEAQAQAQAPPPLPPLPPPHVSASSSGSCASSSVCLVPVTKRRRTCRSPTHTAPVSTMVTQERMPPLPGVGSVAAAVVAGSDWAPQVKLEAAIAAGGTRAGVTNEHAAGAAGAAAAAAAAAAATAITVSNATASMTVSAASMTEAAMPKRPTELDPAGSVDPVLDRQRLRWALVEMNGRYSNSCCTRYYPALLEAGIGCLGALFRCVDLWVQAWMDEIPELHGRRIAQQLFAKAIEE
jgi:hypothetical protein